MKLHLPRLTCNLVIVAFGFCTAGIFAGTTPAAPKTSLSGEAKVKYTSNLYNLSDEKEELIDVENAPGERFFGMQGPEDLLYIIGGDATLRWKLKKKCYAKAFVGAKGTYHQDNAIADYERVKGGASADVTRHDNLKLSAYAVSDRFKKNYESSKDHFEPATYDEDGVRLRYLRTINKDWVAGIAVSQSARTFNDPFSPRNRDSEAVVVYTELDVRKGVTLALGAGSLQAQTGVETIVKKKYSYPRDRSFDQEHVEASVHLKCPQGWRASVGALFTTKEYTSSEPLDTLYNGRVDDIVKYAASLARKVRDNVAVVVEVSLTEKQSNRVDDGDSEDDEEVNYETAAFGAAVEITF